MVTTTGTSVGVANTQLAGIAVAVPVVCASIVICATRVAAANTSAGVGVAVMIKGVNVAVWVGVGGTGVAVGGRVAVWVGVAVSSTGVAVVSVNGAVVSVNGNVVVSVPAASARTRLGIASVATTLSVFFSSLRKNIKIMHNPVSQICFIIAQFPNPIRSTVGIIA